MRRKRLVIAAAALLVVLTLSVMALAARTSDLTLEIADRLAAARAARPDVAPTASDCDEEPPEGTRALRVTGAYLQEARQGNVTAERRRAAAELVRWRTEHCRCVPMSSPRSRLGDEFLSVEGVAQIQLALVAAGELAVAGRCDEAQAASDCAWAQAWAHVSEPVGFRELLRVALARAHLLRSDCLARADAIAELRDVDFNVAWEAMVLAQADRLARVGRGEEVHSVFRRSPYKVRKLFHEVAVVRALSLDGARRLVASIPDGSRPDCLGIRRRKPLVDGVPPWNFMAMSAEDLDADLDLIERVRLEAAMTACLWEARQSRDATGTCESRTCPDVKWGYSKAGGTVDLEWIGTRDVARLGLQLDHSGELDEPHEREGRSP